MKIMICAVLRTDKSDVIITSNKKLSTSNNDRLIVIVSPGIQ
jgi:hypothetical protein